MKTKIDDAMKVKEKSSLSVKPFLSDISLSLKARKFSETVGILRVFYIFITLYVYIIINYIYNVCVCFMQRGKKFLMPIKLGSLWIIRIFEQCE